MRGQQLFHGCQASEAITRFEEVLKLLPEGWLYPRGAARFYWALCMRAMGKVDAARMSLTEEFESLVDRTDAYAPRLAFGMAFNHLETGHLEEARQTAQMMLDLASPGHLMILQGFGRFFLGTAHYCWNDLATAEKHFREGVEIRRATHAQAARSCMLGMALVLMAKGETGEAREMLELLSQLDMERTGVVGDDARSLQAQLEYSQGNAEAAFRWADAYSSPVPDRLINFIQDPHLAKASSAHRTGCRRRPRSQPGHPRCAERNHRTQLLHAAADRHPRCAGGGVGTTGQKRCRSRQPRASGGERPDEWIRP